ncbi:MAG: TIM barrel protein [Sphingomonas sp.]
MSRLISLASGVLPEFSAAQVANAAVQGGWPAVGLWVEPPNWSARTTREVRRIVEEGGISVLDVEVIWLQPGKADPDHLRIMDIGAEVGARNVLVVSSDTDAGSATHKFAALCAHGEALGLRVALEFGFFTEVRSLEQAMAIVGAAASPAGAILIDPLHLERTGGTAREVADIPRELLPYAQFCDAWIRGPGAGPDDVAGIIEEAIDQRLMCGAGCLPQIELLAALPAMAPLSIEIRSKRLRETFPDPVARSRTVFESTRAFLERLPEQAGAQ